MARTLEVVCQGRLSSFVVAKIERRKLYGYKRRVGIDAAGRECSSALLTQDGRHLLPAGATAELYLDEQGDVVDRKDIMVCDAEGKPLPKLPATTGAPQELLGPVTLEAILDCVITDAYQVDFESLDGSLRPSLARGDIFRFTFRPRATHIDHPAFLLANEEGVFVLVGREAHFDFIGLGQTPPVVEIEDGDGEEHFSLDFEMF